MFLSTANPATVVTYHKILNHFFCPGLKSDAFQHCKSCHSYQMVGNPFRPSQKLNYSPFLPSSRINIDFAGPLFKTKSGCQYLLTIMCALTRFPETIALRNSKTKTIVKALVNFFAFVGLPGSVQIDQGSNNISGIFNKACMNLASHLLIILKVRCLRKISSNFALTQKMIGMRAYICFICCKEICTRVSWVQPI